MGISDVLMEAIGEMEEYQEALPELYEPVREEIEVLKEEMRVLIRRLNLPPDPEPAGYVATVVLYRH
jgi:hypothetical protein